MLDRKRITETVREAADRAGALVAAALLLSAGALIIALVALITARASRAR